MVLATASQTGYIYYAEVNPWGTISSWQQDPGGYQTPAGSGVNLSSPTAGGSGAVYSLIAGNNRANFWSTVIEGNQGSCDNA
jgi:hypothetical protein